MRHPPLRWNRLTSHIQPSVLRMSGRGLRPAWTRVVKAKVRQKAETDSQNKQRRPAYPHVPSGRNRAQAQGFPHQEGVGGQSGLAKKGRAKAVDHGFDDAGADQTPNRHLLQTKQGHAYRSLTTSDRYGAIGGDRGEDQGKTNSNSICPLGLIWISLEGIPCADEICRICLAIPMMEPMMPAATTTGATNTVVDRIRKRAEHLVRKAGGEKREGKSGRAGRRTRDERKEGPAGATTGD